jgi:hypothetical protein
LASQALRMTSLARRRSAHHRPYMIPPPTPSSIPTSISWPFIIAACISFLRHRYTETRRPRWLFAVIPSAALSVLTLAVSDCPAAVWSHLTLDVSVRLRSVRTFYTSSSRANTARTHRRLLRPALAPAPRARRAAGARHSWPVGCSFGGDRHRGKWVTSGGAGRIGSKRLDPGAPTSPRPAIAGRPRACRRSRAPPSPSFTTATVHR